MLQRQNLKIKLQVCPVLRTRGSKLYTFSTQYHVKVGGALHASAAFTPDKQTTVNIFLKAEFILVFCSINCSKSH